MRLNIKLLLLFLIPVSVFAQDTVSLRKQANAVANAIVKGDYNTLIAHMYPKFVQLAGGREKIAQKIAAGNDQMKTLGGSFQSATIGSPGKFYKAGTEIHCLVPQYTRVKLPNGSIVNHGTLLAITPNKGKIWYFLDLNKNSIAEIPKLFPNFNKNLKLPDPKTPGF